MTGAVPPRGWSIRRATGDLAELEAIAAVFSAVAPDQPAHPDELRWADERYPETVRLLALAPDRRAVGAATVGRIWMQPPGYDASWADLAVLAEHRRQGIGSALLDACREIARAAGKSNLDMPASERRPEGISFLEHRGFREIERAKSIALALAGLDAPAPRLPPGVALVTLAERPDLVAGVHALAVEAWADIPGGDPPVPGPLEEFRAREVDRPEFPHDAFFVALDAAGEVAGYANLFLSRALPRVGYHNMTAVRRTARNRGIGSALKRSTIGWAIRAGLETLETDNDEANAPMRAVNARLGYRPLPDRLVMRGPTAPGGAPVA